MIGMWSAYSSDFLRWFPILIMVLFALPMIFAPLSWARVVGWNLPQDTDLAIYFGRSLGVAAAGICLICFVASGAEAAQAAVFDGLILISALYVVTHLHGAVTKTQPLLETLEIGFWLLLLLTQLAVYPADLDYGLLN